MPAGAINALDNITSEKVRPKPYLILILLVFAIFLVLYSQRILNITNGYYNLFVTSIILFLISVVLISTIIHNFKFTRNEYLEYLSDTFNSTPSRNFLILFSFLLFIMFVYETEQYNNNEPYTLLDTITFGHNNYVSNRFYGLMLIIIFGTYTAYSIYVTTNDK